MVEQKTSILLIYLPGALWWEWINDRKIFSVHDGYSGLGLFSFLVGLLGLGSEKMFMLRPFAVCWKTMLRLISSAEQSIFRKYRWGYSQFRDWREVNFRYDDQCFLIFHYQSDGRIASFLFLAAPACFDVCSFRRAPQRPIKYAVKSKSILYWPRSRFCCRQVWKQNNLPKHNCLPHHYSLQTLILTQNFLRFLC